MNASVSAAVAMPAGVSIAPLRTSHIALGMATTTHVAMPIHVRLRASIGFMLAISVPQSEAERRHAPHLHVGELRSRAPADLGLDEVRAEVRAQLAREREARQRGAVAQAGDRDELDVDLLIR